MSSDRSRLWLSNSSKRRERVRQKQRRQTRRELLMEALEIRTVMATAEADLPFGNWTPEEIARIENKPIVNLLRNGGSPFLPGQGPLEVAGEHGPQPARDIASKLTVVLDFKSPGEPTTVDIFGNQVGTLDVTAFGFPTSAFNTVANSVLAEVDRDYHGIPTKDKLSSSPIPACKELAIDFVIGNIGTPPSNGATEYYYVQIGEDLSGVGALGVAGLAVVRNAIGAGPNSGVSTGDVVGSIFSDTIQGMGGLSPSNALSSGNLVFTTFALAGTTSHEIGHTLSLTHMAKAGAVTPTGAPPIMGTGAIDMPNQDRIGDREFALSGFDSERGGAPVFHIQQLVGALGLRDVLNCGGTSGPQGPPPRLAGIQPNEGSLLEPGQLSVLNVAPRELRLSFSEGQVFNPTNIQGIKITRTGFDDIFDNGNDIVIQPGFIGADESPNRNVVVLRFAETLPDDTYRVEIFGADNASQGVLALRNSSGVAFAPTRAGTDRDVVQFKLDLGAQIIAVVPQPVDRVNGVLTQRRNQIEVYFNNDDLYNRAVKTGDLTPDPDPSVVRTGFYQLILTRGTVRNTDDLVFTPTSVAYDPVSDMAVLTFADDLEKLVNPGTGQPIGPGSFRLRVGTDEARPAPPVEITPVSTVATDFNSFGQVTITFRASADFGRALELHFDKQDLGPGSPPSVSVNGNRISLVLNSNAVTPTLAQELVTLVNTSPALDGIMTASITAGLSTTDIATPAVNYSPLRILGQGSSFATATEIGNLVTPQRQNQIFSAAIDPQPFNSQLPGAPDEPGHRELPAEAGGGLEQHLNPNFPMDVVAGVRTISYNFRADYGVDSQGTPLTNSITEPQKQRIREDLEIWSRYLGVQFVETNNSGWTFATGDLTVLSTTAVNVRSHANFNMRVRIDPSYSNSLLILNAQTNWNDQPFEDYSRVSMLGIAYMLGLGVAADLPTTTLMSLDPGLILGTAGADGILPGDYDVIHGQLLHRPDSNDIDLYRFNVDFGANAADKVGLLTAEVFAERQADASALDSYLRLYREIDAANASVTTDFNTTSAVLLKFTAVRPGRHGNDITMAFSKANRGAVRPPVITVVGNHIDVELNDTPNQRTRAIDLINALNNSGPASALIRASLVSGLGAIDITSPSINYSPLALSGGRDIRREVIAKNDDYFSKDSMLQMSLPAGTYYLGVSAKANDQYDPTIEDTGLGGRTQGPYRLQLNFRPAVDNEHTIRDRDRIAEGLPGTVLDGDANGTPGGVFNFWFQTQNLERVLEVTGGGASLVDGQFIDVTNNIGLTKRFEFNLAGGVTPGNIPVNITAPMTRNQVATTLANAIAGGAGFNTPGMATVSGSLITLKNDRAVSLSANAVGVKVHGKTIFVDKAAVIGSQADGSLARPFDNIASTVAGVPAAFKFTNPGDIVRIVGNGGPDGNTATLNDNFAYEIGFGILPGQTLVDGTTMEVPRGVTVMVDAGAIFKMRSAQIAVGSSNLNVDRSHGALQILGTPRQSVFFTSWLDETIGRDTYAPATFPTPGNWGGIVFKNDLDRARGEFDRERDGTFINYVNHADIRYGGGIVNVDSVGHVVQPIQLTEARPTISYNRITSSADSAISADPNSFDETNFHSANYQLSGQFTSDYDRVGPDIHGNRIVNNSINGLIVRITTAPGDASKPLTLAGRFDDTDIVHYLAESLIVQGTPGGSIQETRTLPLNLVTLTTSQIGTLAAGTYNYRVTMVDADGFEGPASSATGNVTLASTGSIRLGNIPGAVGEFVARRVYRSAPGGAGPYTLLAQISRSALTYEDDGGAAGGTLNTALTSLQRPRLDARLVIDPGTVVKLEGARIEISFGAQLLVEGLTGEEIVLTSKLDDRFGAGGTFDTNNDDNQGANERQPNPADWSGIYLGHTSTGNFDHALIAYAGGISKLEGTFKAFNVLEVHQSDLRLAHSIIEKNASGVGGQGPANRLGRSSNLPAVMFVRGAQPIIVENVFRGNDSQILGSSPQQPTININANSLNATRLPDSGRERGDLDLLGDFRDNHGPLIRGNLQSRNGINGMLIRGTTLTTEGIWDDTDMVHVMFDAITVGNLHTYGGIRLQSRPDESLVVKLFDGIGPNGHNFVRAAGTGFTATGTPLDMTDRIGGTLHVIGQPGFPVVLTSFHDDSVGAGLTPDHRPLTDTNNNGIASIPRPEDWRGLLIEQYSHDRNVEMVLETELRDAVPPGTNAQPATAQFLGDLAAKEQNGDSYLRMGFRIEGLINAPADVDIYSMTAVAGTEIWLDIDRSTYAFDTVVEVLDANGNVLARSDDSAAEQSDRSLLVTANGIRPELVNPLRKSPLGFRDYWSYNPRDAGMRMVLPGTVGVRSTYHFRVRSSSGELDLSDAGLTSGYYQFQIRTREVDEFAGSTVRFADIRYATNGIEIHGLPGHSPLLGEAAENEEVATAVDPESNNNVFSANPSAPGNRPQYLGNILTSDRGVVSVGGSISGTTDVDVYQFEVNYTQLQQPNRPALHAFMTFDVDYADGLSRPDTSIAIFDAQRRLVLIGTDSNIADDRPRPLETNDFTDLSRGTVGPNDAFIGTVALPVGTYFAAVYHSNQIPAALLNPLVRLEPIDSVTRLVEDHIGSSGGSTAGLPVYPEFLDPTFAGVAPNLWHATSKIEPGSSNHHGLRPAFDLSRGTLTAASTITEIEPNDSIGTAQDINNSKFWSKNFDPSIGDATANTSTTIPHVTITGTGNKSFDYYRFSVAKDKERGIFDIDYTSPGLNTQIFLYDAAGNPVTDAITGAACENDDSATSAGDAGSTSIDDSFIDCRFPTAGNYILGIARFPSTGKAGGIVGDPLISGDFYTLQVSLESHAFTTTANKNDTVFYFGDETKNSYDSSAKGDLVSNAFSLQGYSKDDLPRLYFNYFLDGDSDDHFRVWVRHESGPDTLLATNDVKEAFGKSSVGMIANNTGTWRQLRADLGQFAGEDQLRLRFEFDAEGTATGFDRGAFIDDIVIGFAERGEMVVDSTPGNVGFITTPGLPFGANPIAKGAYQLEIRPGEKYGTSRTATLTNTVGLTLTKDMDTNDRSTEQTTIYAPRGSEIQDGQTFVLGDGINFLTFEFDSGGGLLDPNHIAVPFAATDTDGEVAATIRDIINNPAIQGVLSLQASSAGGQVSGVEDNRILLFGNVSGSLVARPSDILTVTSTTPTANALRDNILGAGITAVDSATLVAGKGSAGTYTGGGSSIGLAQGIILSTGKAAVAKGPNTADSASNNSSLLGDSDLDASYGVTTVDSTSLQFDFQFANGSIGGDLNLQLVFASEEYNELLGTADPDVFAVFVDGMRVILTPGPDPIARETVNAGNPIGINAANSEFYKNNDPNDGGRWLRQFGFDGFTVVLNATVPNLLAGPHTLKIAIADVGNPDGDSALFIGAGSLSAVAPAVSNSLQASFFAADGDSNVFRDQGAMIINSNFISHVRDFAIISDAGFRDSEPGVNFGFGNPHYGAAIKLPALNNQSGDLVGPGGGFVPGALITNNVIWDAGLGGIHVSGDLNPIEITSRVDPPEQDPADTPVQAGDQYCDGEQFSLTSYRTLVYFEFEDISGDEKPGTCFGAGPGSGVTGGDGYVPDHIPIFFRRTNSTEYLGRTVGYTENEMARAIAAAINGSLLVTNGTTLNAGSAIVGPSRRNGRPAVFVNHITGYVHTFMTASDIRRVPLGMNAVPFAHLANNTLYGNDGFAGTNPQAYAEPNDSQFDAIDTRQGPQHHSVAYTATGRIGDNADYRIDPSLDVDFFRFQLAVGDRVTVDIDAAQRGGGSTLNPYLRLFDSIGQEVLASDDDPAPGETPSVDSFLNYVADRAGTYYVAVSGRGTNTYDPFSQGNRPGSSSTGPYDITIDVRAPRNAAIYVNKHGTTIAAPEHASPLVVDGQAFQIEDMTGNVVTFEFDTNGAAVNPGAVLIPINNTAVPDSGGHGAGFMADEVAVAIRNAINGSPLGNGITLSNGEFGTASPHRRVTARALGGDDGGGGGFPTHPDGRLCDFGFGHDLPETSLCGTTERLVVIQNVARIRDINTGLAFYPGGGDNFDQYLPETGILASERSGPTSLNNLFANLQAGFVGISSEQFSHPAAQVITGSAFQFNGSNTNVSAAGIDFNVQIPVGERIFVDPGSGRFFPYQGSRIIDSAINQLDDRQDFANRVKRTVGITPTPILAPTQDATGQLRVDDPSTASPQGLFRDRGGLDRADFSTPTVILTTPLDNDSEGIDNDPTATVVQVTSGFFNEFRLQLEDQFGADNPFPGTGADDDTVLTGPILVDELNVPVTLRGPVVTLFENNRLLREGLDYAFRYDSITNTISLAPLAGIWGRDNVYQIMLNNRDRFVIDADHGGSLVDGDAFTITDDNGNRIAFEYEGGYKLNVPPVLELVVPAIGAGPGGISDGQRFSVNDGKRSVTFEFDTNGSLPTLPTRVVSITSTSSATQIAQAIASTIQQAVNAGALAGLQTKALARGLVHVGASAATSVSVTGSNLTTNLTQVPLSLRIPAAGVGPGGVTDGQFFRITNAGTTRTFEFDNDSLLNGNSIPIAFSALTTIDQLTTAVVSAINSAAVLQLNAAAGPLGSGIINFTNGSASHIVDVANTVLTRRMFVGGINDGETFTIQHGAAPLVKFEFDDADDDGRFTDANNDNVPDNVLVAIQNGDSREDIADKIVLAIRNAGLGLSPIHFGGGNIQVAGTTAHVVDTRFAPSLALAGLPGVSPSTTIQLPISLAIEVPLAGGLAITDGSTFTLRDGTQTQVFEFDSDGKVADTDKDLVPDNTVIIFFPTDDQDSVSTAIVGALNGAIGQLQPSYIGNGHVILGNRSSTKLDLGNTNLTSTVRVHGLVDADGFTIDDGNKTVGFEFEDLGIGNGVTAGSIQILFQDGDLASNVADAVVGAIQISGLGSATNPINPANVGGGAVRLNETGRYLTRVLNYPNTKLATYGTAGGSVAIPFRPDISFNDQQMAIAITAAINTPEARQRLQGVTARHRGGSTVFVDFVGANGQQIDFSRSPANVAGANNFFLRAIQDVAGNDLRSNQANGDTQFTILMPGTRLDFGDLPDPFSGPGRYPTVVQKDAAFIRDGARHAILSNAPLYLGSMVDQDTNGLPSPSAEGDNTDIEIDATLSPTLTVSGSGSSRTITVGDITTALDGQAFTINDLNRTVTFEFDRNEDVIDTRTIIRFSSAPIDATTSSKADVAARIVDAIHRSGLAVAVADLGNGQVRLDVNDDDGVVFADLFNRFLYTPINVTASGAGFLDAFIDYNQDGDFDDPNERLVFGHDVNGDGDCEDAADQVAAGTTIAVVAGLNRLCTKASPTASPGFTFARFRISSLGGLPASGFAADGEVEDYKITITPGTPPVAVADSYSTNEDTQLNVSAPGLILNDTDAENDILSVLRVNGSPANVGVTIDLAFQATLVVNPNGSFTYDPRPSTVMQSLPAGATAEETFSYRLTDGVLPSNDTTVTISVLGVNDAPVAKDNRYTTNEDTALGGNLVTDDTKQGVDFDIDTGDQFTVTALNGVNFAGSVNSVLPSGARLSLSTDGTFDYDPSTAFDFLAAGTSQTDSFVYTISDKAGLTASATVVMTVQGINDAPVAVTNTYLTDEDTQASGNVITDDTGAGKDVDLDKGAVLSILAVNGDAANVGKQFSLPSGANLTLNLDGTFSYDPTTSGALNALALGKTGQDTFTYSLTDGIGGSVSTTTVTMTIAGRNDAPIALNNSYTVDDNSLLSRNAILDDEGTRTGPLGSKDSDPDQGDTLAVSAVDGGAANVGANHVLPSGATLKMNGDGSFTYDPSTSKSLNGLSQGQTGKDSFTYTIRDPHGATSTATVSLTITGVNDAPVATNDLFTTSEDIALTTDNLMRNDNGNGVDSDSDLADTLVVSAINGIAGNVGKTISLKSGSSLRVNLDGSFVYDPTISNHWQSLPAGQSGKDTFTYSISDNKGGSSTATVTVTASGVNDVPVATANNYATNEDTATSGNVMSDNTGKGVDSDVDAQDLISVSAVDGNPVFAAGDTTITLASGATLLINSSGNFTYNPGTSALLQGLRQGESTTDTFVYTIKDLQNAAASATVTLAISGLNDAPIARNNAYSIDENSVLSQNMRIDAPADTDADFGDTMTVIDVNGVPVPSTGLKLTLPLGASLNVAQSGAFTYDPRSTVVFDQLAPGQSRGDSFTYTIRDALGATSKATVAIDVTGVNDAPRLTDDFFTVEQGTTTVLTVLANDTDVDGTISASTVAIKTTPSSGKATVNANGTVTYVADSTTVGDVKLTYIAKDNLGAESNPATVTITVRSAPSPWQNQANALDVNASGFVEPIDALLVINRINRVGSGPVPSPATPPPFFDVDGNRFIAPADAILVINFLNSLSLGGEGEGPAAVGTTDPDGMELARQMESAGVFVADVDQRWTMEPVVTARVWTAEDAQRRSVDSLWSLPAILEPTTSRAQRVEGAISQLVQERTEDIWQHLAGRTRAQLIDDLFGTDGESW